MEKFICFLKCNLLLERETSQEIPLRNISARSHSIHLTDSNFPARDGEDDGEIHYFDFTTILTATNNFSGVNKLREGGFSPVYKVKSFLFIFLCICIFWKLFEHLHLKLIYS